MVTHRSTNLSLSCLYMPEPIILLIARSGYSMNQRSAMYEAQDMDRGLRRDILIIEVHRFCRSWLPRAKLETRAHSFCIACFEEERSYPAVIGHN